MRPGPDRGERILLVSVDRLGDLVWTLPALDHIRTSLPGAHLAFLASRYTSGLLEGHPQVDHLYTLERNTNDIGRFLHLRRLFRELDREPPERMLFFKEGKAGRALQRHYPRAASLSVERWPLEERLGLHACRVRMMVAEAFCGPCRGDGIPRLTVPPAFREGAVRRAASLDFDPARALILHPGVNRLVRHRSLFSRGKRRSTPRTWAPERWIELTRALLDRGLTPLLTGSGAEARVCRRIAAAAGPGCRVAAAGLHPLELAGLCAGARGLVAGDTGPGHLAAAVGTPVVSLFGPTDPAITGPVAPPERLRIIWHPPDCGPCPEARRRECDETRCIDSITVAEVMAACAEMGCLEEAGRVAAGGGE